MTRFDNGNRNERRYIDMKVELDDDSRWEMLFNRGTEARLRRSRAGLALVVTGCILLLLAPAWRLVIAPLFIRLPDDLEVIGAYTGKMTLFAERQTSKFYPPGLEVTTPI